MLFTDVQWARDRERVFATFVCSHCAEEGRPVLLVSKERNGDVQLLCGAVHRSRKEIRVVHLAHFLDQDASLKDLADLPLGWEAERKSLRAKWVRSKQ